MCTIRTSRNLCHLTSGHRIGCRLLKPSARDWREILRQNSKWLVPKKTHRIMCHIFVHKIMQKNRYWIDKSLDTQGFQKVCRFIPGIWQAREVQTDQLRVAWPKAVRSQALRRFAMWQWAKKVSLMIELYWLGLLTPLVMSVFRRATATSHWMSLDIIGWFVFFAHVISSRWHQTQWGVSQARPSTSHGSAKASCKITMASAFHEQWNSWSICFTNFILVSRLESCIPFTTCLRVVHRC